MINLTTARMTGLMVHKVGNKARAEGVVSTTDFLSLDETTTDILQDYFLSPFKSDDFYSQDQSGRKSQIVLQNNALGYFSSHQEYEHSEFLNGIIFDPETKEAFESFRIEYETTFELSAAEEGFQISKAAVKAMRRDVKSIMKLDTRIEIKLDPRYAEEAGDFIELGFDEQRGMHFYRVFFNEQQ